MQSVQGALRSCTRQAPSVAKNLKDKMHTVKAMERRFEKKMKYDSDAGTGRSNLCQIRG